MLRITVHEDPGTIVFQLEGKLAGPWVQEAKDSWQHLVARQPQPTVRVDLVGLTMIDEAGKEFLTAAHAQGAELVASGCLMRAIVAELANNT